MPESTEATMDQAGTRLSGEPSTGDGDQQSRQVRRHRWLVTAGWLFGVASAVHIIDHLRRGQGSVSDELHWLGTVALVAQVVVVVLVVTEHRLGPWVAVILGFPLGAGFLAAHWLPHWSPMSDPVWEIGSWGWFSYLASSAEIVGAFVVGLAGLAVLRHDRPGRSVIS